MPKSYEYTEELTILLAAFLDSGDDEVPSISRDRPLRDMLMAHSNLPGPRGNLELAGAFADALAQGAGQASASLWSLCLTMANVTSEAAPTNSAQEFVPFCGTLGAAALGAAVPELAAPAIALLRHQANDPRWRVREAVAMGLQRLLIARRPDHEFLHELARWAENGTWLELRAVAAAVAEPAIVKDRDVALSALALHRTILNRVCSAGDRKAADLRVLRQGLGYTISVIVAAVPDAGFVFMEELARSEDPDVLWIVRENLKKNRLVRNYPHQVAALQNILNRPAAL